jgi:hypothetical protein
MYSEDTARADIAHPEDKWKVDTVRRVDKWMADRIPVDTAPSPPL